MPRQNPMGMGSHVDFKIYKTRQDKTRKDTKRNEEKNEKTSKTRQGKCQFVAILDTI